MEYTSFGNTSIRISRLGFGCAAMGGHGWGNVDDSQSIEAVHRALDLGVNLFDTADVYGLGHAEEILGQALGSRRGEVILATKFGVSWDSQGKTGRNCSPSYLAGALERSLKRLKTDYVDLYQIHWPDPSTPIEETMAALLKAREDGKIRYLGCSNMGADLLARALLCGRIDSLQAPYSLLRREIEPGALDACRRNGLSLLAYDVLNKGLLTGKYSLTSEFGPEDLRLRDPQFKGERLAANLKLVDLLRSVGAGYGKTAAQVALRWVLQNPSVGCALSGIKTLRQLQENVGASDWALSREHYELLSTHSSKPPPTSVEPA